MLQYTEFGPAHSVIWAHLAYLGLLHVVFFYTEGVRICKQYMLSFHPLLFSICNGFFKKNHRIFLKDKPNYGCV
jgi:hypothetical protein